MEKYSVEIVNAIKSFLEDDDWHFSFDEEEGVFKFALSIKSRIKKLHYLIRIHDEDYTVYAFSPIGADEDDHEMMMKMAEFICRANYGLRNGNFELDVRDGEIRYKIYVDCEDGAIPTEAIIRQSIYCPAAMFDRYGSGITEIIFGNATAREAITKCESAELQELFEEVAPECDEDTQDMLARLAARLGVTEEDLEAQPEIPSDQSADVKTELFQPKGGVA